MELMALEDELHRARLLVVLNQDLEDTVRRQHSEALHHFDRIRLYLRVYREPPDDHILAAIDRSTSLIKNCQRIIDMQHEKLLESIEHLKNVKNRVDAFRHHQQLLHNHH